MSFWAGVGVGAIGAPLLAVVAAVLAILLWVLPKRRRGR
jgi:hypothetical protein